MSIDTNKRRQNPTTPSSISKDQVSAALEQLIAARLIEKTERGYRLPMSHDNGAAATERART
ncbi:MAG: hypothetical protein Q8M07_02610 [Prosthecobacter sp.]|nr:hypothetical protein [Prosthecobacter sp.]